MNGWLTVAACVVFPIVACLGVWKALRARLPRVRRVTTWSVAVLIGAASFLLPPGYPVDDRTRALGFPLPAAFFQQDESGRWLDYAGPLTPVLIFANGVVNAGVVLYIGTALLTRRRRTTDDRGEDGAA
jgi:hypothetical protein